MGIKGRSDPPTRLQCPGAHSLKGEKVMEAGSRVQDQVDGGVGGRNLPFIEHLQCAGHGACFTLK